MFNIDRMSKQALYEQVYLQIRNDILDGTIKYDSRLPSTRTLADNLHLGRNTVILAYNQLEVEGYIRSIKGSGSYVNKVSELKFITKQDIGAMSCKNTFETEVLSVKFDFQYGSIDTNIFPVNSYRRCMLKAFEDVISKPSLTYTDKQGEFRLRKEINNYLYQARGVICSPEQVIITSGHHQSLEIITKLLTNKNYSFSIENPGYNGTRLVFEDNNYKINPISLENDGVSIEEIYKLSSTLLYVTPSHQFPTGSVLPVKKRLAILEWADESNSYIIEDDYDSELRYNMLPIPSLHSLDKYRRTIYLGTFSKSLSPDLRISYMVLPSNIYDIYNRLFKSTNCTVPKVLQIALANFFEEGYFEKHQNTLKTHYKKKYELLCNSIKNTFKNDAIIQGTSAGLHILLSINCPYNQEEIVEKALESGVKVYPVNIYWAQQNHCLRNQVMLGFGSISLKDIPIAIDKLHKSILG